MVLLLLNKCAATNVKEKLKRQTQGKWRNVDVSEKLDSVVSLRRIDSKVEIEIRYRRTSISFPQWQDIVKLKFLPV